MAKDGVPIARHDHHLAATTNVADHREFADDRRALCRPAGGAGSAD
ncbi:glycerophosphodiester phosphodiesterase family protein [Hyphomonas sp.]|nr:glycerophosphodiester phosphodiesterase family protein [Hyphomonas sp.]